MKILLDADAKIKKGCTIIEGFPGFGLVGPIATEFLTEHLKTRIVGRFEHDELPATTAIHKGKVVQPMAVHHDPTHNLVILHTILSVKGYEWEAAREVQRLATQLKAKEIISLEGVNAMTPGEETKVYAYGAAFPGAEQMQESVIMGVTASLLLHDKRTRCLFAETHTGLPDSKASAAVVTTLSKHLGLRLDPAPLLQQAEAFEAKLKNLLQQTQQTTNEAEKKQLSYLG